MSAAHTEGLLFVKCQSAGSYQIKTEDGHDFLSGDEYCYAYIDNEGDARRLVACWNALKDMSTEEIERVSLAGSTASNVVRQAFIEFDQLVAARALLAELLNDGQAFPSAIELSCLDGVAWAERVHAFLKGGAE